jgi:hypothetical protein
VLPFLLREHSWLNNGYLKLNGGFAYANNFENYNDELMCVKGE